MTYATLSESLAKCKNIKEYEEIEVSREPPANTSDYEYFYWKEHKIKSSRKIKTKNGQYYVVYERENGTFGIPFRI